MTTNSSGKHTAFCGLYCRDCIPSNHPLYAVMQELEELLAACNFEHYAEFKSHTQPVFADYSRFVQVLHEIKNLECMHPCTAGGGKQDCLIRNCVLARSYRGCWECAERKACHLLAPLKAVHHNLDCHHHLINTLGLDNWADQRGRHYAWEESRETPKK